MVGEGRGWLGQGARHGSAQARARECGGPFVGKQGVRGGDGGVSGAALKAREGEQRRGRAWLSSTGRRGVACAGGAERQRRQGRDACSTSIISGSGTQRGGRQCSSGDGTRQAGACASCGMMAAQLCAREAGTKQRSEGREREEREVRELTLIFLKIFNWMMKKFKYKSCLKFKILQLSFQAQTHLKLRLRVKI